MKISYSFPWSDSVIWTGPAHCRAALPGPAGGDLTAVWCTGADSALRRFLPGAATSCCPAAARDGRIGRRYSDTAPHHQLSSQRWTFPPSIDSAPVKLGMLLEESEAPMDFSRRSELSELQRQRAEMELAEQSVEAKRQKLNDNSRGLDLSNSVLDKLSQKVIR